MPRVTVLFFSDERVRCRGAQATRAAPREGVVKAHRGIRFVEVHSVGLNAALDVYAEAGRGRAPGVLPRVLDRFGAVGWSRVTAGAKPARAARIDAKYRHCFARGGPRPRARQGERPRARRDCSARQRACTPRVAGAEASCKARPGHPRVRERQEE